MHSWRENILREFAPDVSRLTLVADPDGLITEEGVLNGIKELGFELIPFDDHVAFRFVYESKYRSKWDRGEITDLVVVLRAETDDLSKLPYDLLQAGRQLSFNLGDIFPNLSYPVLEQLYKSDLDALYKAQTEHAPGRLGDNATKDFVLRHVFEIELSLIKQPSDLLRVLLRKHYRKQDAPRTFDDRIVSILRQNDEFAEWPLEEIVPKRESFFTFLQERWPYYLERIASQDTVGEQPEGYCLEYPGPLDIPFGHDDVRVYIDNLFLEGLMRPIVCPSPDILAKKWVKSGVIVSKEDDAAERLEPLLRSISESLPDENVRHRDWLSFACKWAQVQTFRYACRSDLDHDLAKRIATTEQDIEDRFSRWVFSRYAGLHNLPPSKPAMVHHVPHYMARHVLESQVAKMALVVVDGMALDQWIAIREEVLSTSEQVHFREDAVFAWAPTLTSVSRQAIFSGKPPLYYPDSISSTNKESAYWKQFWVDRELRQEEVGYARAVGETQSLDKVRDLLSYPKMRIVGLVVDKVDKIMHGMELGAAGMHNQVRQWTRDGFLFRLLSLLHEHGYDVLLTSDHGNTEVQGCGRPKEGVVADTRGERVRIYSTETLRSTRLSDYPDAILWPTIGLPDDYLPLIAPNGFAFVPAGKRIVAHGGVSLQELIVPFVHVKWSNE